jgi:hypothetical protein
MGNELSAIVVVVVAAVVVVEVRAKRPGSEHH